MFYGATKPKGFCSILVIVYYITEGNVKSPEGEEQEQTKLVTLM